MTRTVECPECGYVVDYLPFDSVTLMGRLYGDYLCVRCGLEFLSPTHDLTRRTVRDVQPDPSFL